MGKPKDFEDGLIKIACTQTPALNADNVRIIFNEYTMCGACNTLMARDPYLEKASNTFVPRSRVIPAGNTMCAGWRIIFNKYTMCGPCNTLILAGLVVICSLRSICSHEDHKFSRTRGFLLQQLSRMTAARSVESKLFIPCLRSMQNCTDGQFTNPIVPQLSFSNHHAFGCNPVQSP